jgi:F-type H+-transporting ATPase subunit gamma
MLAHMGKRGNERIICLGIKGWEFFKARNKNILSREAGVSETALYDDAAPIGDMVASMFAGGEMDEVYLAYSYFESALSYKPRIEKILPIGMSDVLDDEKALVTEYEPDVNTFISGIAPDYIKASIHIALTESSCCEHAARMNSMSAAANNAEDILKKLTLDYNRERQAIITQEISEIIAGAEHFRADI